MNKINDKKKTIIIICLHKKSYRLASKYTKTFGVLLNAYLKSMVEVAMEGCRSYYVLLVKTFRKELFGFTLKFIPFFLTRKHFFE